jgi:hypothetical protein
MRHLDIDVSDLFKVAITPSPTPRRRNPPMKIGMLMHFHGTLEAYTPERSRQSRAYVQFVKELLHDGLIERPTAEERVQFPGFAYRTTRKGAALVNAICNVQNPVVKWVIPS